MKYLIDLYKKESNQIFDNISNDEIYLLWENVKYCYDNNKSIFIAGNGGNAGYVANMYTDFMLHPFVSDDKSIKLNYKRLRCYNLTDSSSTITGIGNDLGYQYIFSEQVEALGQPKDLFIGITGSGTSKNIVECINICKKMNITPFIITKNAHIEERKIVISGVSEFPGQVGKNMANFHFEDCISKITHIITGLLKEYVSKSNS